PKGLIRYASEDEIVEKAPFRFTARMKGYTAVLVILIGILGGLLLLRSNVDATILRVPGQLFEHKGENISNVYTFRIVNKTTRDFDDLQIKLLSPEGKVIPVRKTKINVPKQGIYQGTIFIEINQHLIESEKTKLRIGIYLSDELLQTTSTNFLGPRTFN